MHGYGWSGRLNLLIFTGVHQRQRRPGGTQLSAFKDRNEERLTMQCWILFCSQICNSEDRMVHCDCNLYHSENYCSQSKRWARSVKREQREGKQLCFVV